MNIQFVRAVAGIITPLFLFNPISSYLMRKARAGNETPAPEVSFILYDYDEPMEIHTKVQSKFLLANTGVGTPKYNGKSELSRPQSAVLAWDVETDGDVDFDEYRVYFSENADFSNADVYVTSDSEVRIFNVKLDTTYYWYVSCKSGKLSYRSNVSSFVTEAAAPRNLYVDGVTNVRDMGGWDCAGGKVRQGMVYRTGKLHDDDEENITANGITTMLESLGVKTEIDLRYEVSAREYGALGESVKYVLLPLDFSDDMMLDDTQAGYIREFFGVLAEEKNYPVFFHCAIGTDRTGVCAFLLNGLLGVCEEDLYRDYKFSNMGFIGGGRDGHNIEHDIMILENYAGDTLADRIESYLISIGVTADEIRSVKTILVEKN